MLRTLGAGAGATVMLPWLSDAGLIAFTEIQRRNAAPRPKALTAAQFATLQALVEAIIPTDERSPGAKEARVADYIDLLISEADENAAASWRAGLDALDANATARFGTPFLGLADPQTDMLLAELSRNDAAAPAVAAVPPDPFFAMAKQATIHGYYTSEIGIHQELRYKGNQFLPAFVGCATVDGKDCPHCGQKAEG
jgi:hypothetical protein